MKLKCVIGLALIFCVGAASISRGQIPKVTQENFKQKLKEKRCMFLYATKANCKKCKLLYNKYVTVSQTFANEPNIFFGTFSDKALVKVFEVKKFPAVVYYELGSTVPKIYDSEITTAALSEVVAKAIKEDFESLDVRYAVQLTVGNFDDIVGNSQQYRLVMLHAGNDVEEINIFDEVAKTFDNDLEIVLARINVDVEKYLDNQYIADTYPSFYWYKKGNTDQKKRYGGRLLTDQMKAFLNEQTGVLRNKDGKPNHFAGLIKPLDDILYKHSKNLYNIVNINEIKSDMEAAIKNLPKETDKELTNYYLHLLDELEEDGTLDTIGESRRRLYRQMVSAGPLTLDQLYRKQNIAEKVFDVISKEMVQEASKGAVEIPQNLQDYIKASGASEHGIEFHEEF